jgi:serine/threonine protein kinase/formylglycine-generating enzyme required for sulfatase activity
MERRPKPDPYKLVDTVLADKYQLEEFIGIGGMGAVYRARHVITTREYAVKVLRPDFAIANPDMVEFVLKEARAAASLHHRCIVEVTDAGITPDGLAFLVMEWLYGHTLEAELRERGVMSQDRLALLLEQICDALAHAHDNGIIHRDLKPDNVMIVTDHKGDEMVKLLDFGIAKALGARVTRVMGTLEYASPEQVTPGAKIDHRSDIYSLGVILYQGLTGQRPFRGESDHQLVYQQLEVAPASPRHIRPEIPEAVEAVILRALAKKAEERFETVTDLARSFRRAIASGVSQLVLRCTDSSTGLAVAGAFVYLNGRFAGQTDDAGQWQKENLALKEHLVRIECLGYQSWHQSVPIGVRDRVVITAELVAEPQPEVIAVKDVVDAEALAGEPEIRPTREVGKLYVNPASLTEHSLKMTRPSLLSVGVETATPTMEQTVVEAESSSGGFGVRERGSRVLISTIKRINAALTHGLEIGHHLAGKTKAATGLLVTGIGAGRKHLKSGTNLVATAEGFGQRLLLVPRAGLSLILGVLVVALVTIGVVGNLMFSAIEPEPGAPPAKNPVQADPQSSKPAAPAGMVYVPGGTFWLGRDSSEEYDGPPQIVTVAPFFMDRFEVTCEQYQKFVDATGHPAPADWPNGRFPDGAARLPVTGVSWEEANAYAHWTGKRLPTEEEWEFAARGTEGRLYPWGARWDPKNANAGGQGRLVDVGGFPQGASPFGLFDMAGNAWEWTASDWRVYPGGKPLQPIPGSKVIRGGCYTSSENEVTTTYRIPWVGRGPQLGFRCAKGVNQ